MGTLLHNDRNQKTTPTTDYEYPALCIPRSTQPISETEIRDTFNKSGLGIVGKVVVKPKIFKLNKWEEIRHPNSEETATSTTTDTVYYDNIYVYFKKWNTHNPKVTSYRDKLLNGQTIKIVFNTLPTPIFWRCVAARFKSTTTTYRNTPSA
jgi:hypothetical protein